MNKEQRFYSREDRSLSTNNDFTTSNNFTNITTVFEEKLFVTYEHDDFTSRKSYSLLANKISFDGFIRNFARAQFYSKNFI